MWGNSLILDKYRYARTNPYLVKVIAFFGVLSSLLMGYGFWNYLQLSPWYLIIFGPIAFIFVVNKTCRYFIQLFYQKFDIRKHEQFVQEFWSKNQEPSVDIFLPYAGEDLAIHEEVLKAAAQLNYTNYKVYMLDDAGSKDHEALANKYGFIYLSRPNKGVHKKSGNLEYGYSHAQGEYVLILDADFVPIKDILHDLIPYIASDSKIGILQTPQYFEQTTDVHARSHVEYGGGNIVEDFYRIIMPCRDEFQAAMCVGTSAIYRKSAIQKLNGTPKVHASEDLATGLLITQHGYYVKYLPLIVSMGKSPDTYQGYFKQHTRWCSGNLVFAKYWPKAHLGLPARLVYLINPMHYLSEALTIIFAFQFLLLLYLHTDSLSIWHTFYFLPYVFLSRFVTPLTKSHKSKIGTKLAALNNSYTYLYTYIRMLIKGTPTWHPTGIKISGLHNDFVQAFNMATFISSTYIVLFLFVLLSRPEIFGNYHTYIVLGWSLYSVFWHAMYLTFIAEFVHPFKLANTRNHVQKAFLYVRRHQMFILFFLLGVIAVSHTVLAFLNPTAPIVLALSQLPAREPQTYVTNNIAGKAVEIPEEQVILAASISAHSTALSYERVYGYTVGTGDSVLKLAKKALRDFSNDANLPLTQNQLDDAAYFLYLEMADSVNLKPNDRITFREKTILEALSSTVRN